MAVGRAVGVEAVALKKPVSSLSVAVSHVMPMISKFAVRLERAAMVLSSLPSDSR